jgi:hypothetical protein
LAAALPLKIQGISRVHYTSHLFEKNSGELLQTASGCLQSNGFLFLFGTKESNLDAIYCNTLLQVVTKQFDSKQTVQVLTIPLSGSIEMSLQGYNAVDIVSDIKDKKGTINRLALSFTGCAEFFQGISTDQISSELAYIQRLVSDGVLCLFYFNQFENTNNLAALAPYLNRSSQFIPHAGWEGIMFFAEEECSMRQLSLSPVCKDLMSDALQESNIPIPLVAECIRQIDLLLAEKSVKDRTVLPEYYEQVGGFDRVLQVQGDRLVSQLSAKLTSAKLKRFFQSFLFRDEQGLVRAIPLSMAEISERTNIPNNLVSEVLGVAEQPAYQFIRQENNLYQLASQVMLTHWDEMKQWVLDEEEHINMYLRTKIQAVQYSNGEAELLSGSNLDAALLWLEEADPTLAWATPYAPEFEPTLAYINASAKQRQVNVAAKQRRAKQLLKITRGIAFVVGIAFIVSSLAAVFAGVERNQAVVAKITAETERQAAVQAKEQAVEARELADQERQKALVARNAEQEAKVRAESERVVAVLAKEAADQERMKAVVARNAEQQAKEAAERDRVMAVSARDQAEFERQNAISARSEEQKALVRANENFKNAEKLRLQQESRANALSAFQYYNNNQVIEGLKLARTAYTNNISNGGSAYERDILKALVYGLNAQQPDQYAHRLIHPLRNVAVEPSTGLIAACSIGGLITVFQNGFDKITEIKVAGQKFQSMCFSGSGLLLVGTTNGELLVFDAASGALRSKRQISDQPIRCMTLLDPARQVVALVSGRDVALLDGLSETSVVVNKTVSTDEVPGTIVYSAVSGQLYVSLGEKLFAVAVKNGRFENGLKSIVSINQFVTSMAVATFQGKEYLLVGDKKGSIYLVDAASGVTKLSRKIHESSVSGCHMEALDDHLLIATSGYDHRVYAHYAFQDSAGKFELEASIDFDFHHGWVTDMAAQPSNGTFLTCSKDMSLHLWQFKPQDIFSRVEKILQKEN